LKKLNLKEKLTGILYLLLYVATIWIIFGYGEPTFGLYLLIGMAAFAGVLFYSLLELLEKKPRTNYERKVYQPGLLLRVGRFSWVCLFVVLAGVLNGNVMLGVPLQENVVVLKKYRGGSRAPGWFLIIKNSNRQRVTLQVNREFWELLSGDADVLIRQQKGLLGFYVVTEACVVLHKQQDNKEKVCGEIN